MKSSNITNYVNNGMLEYSDYVLYSRAFPDLRDGLKPSQRRVLWAMYANNVTKFTKSANVVGYVYPYHPHGSSYPTLVNMTCPNKQHIQPIEPHGSFGDATSRDIIPAADRYTECRLGENANIFLKEIKNNGVPVEKNYDETKDIVEVFPTTAPTILFNYSTGIGEGFNTIILPMNPTEVYNLLETKLENKEYDLKYPDFVNGCRVFKDRTELKKWYETGKAKFTLSSVYDIEGKTIIVKAIPENVMRETVIEEIEKLVKNKKVSGIKNIIDASGLNGFELNIETKGNPEEIMDVLLQKTSLQKTISANTNVLENGKFYQLGIDEILNRWIQWRKSVLQREINNYIQQQMTEMKKAQTLIYFKENKDKFLPLITDSEDPKTELLNYFNEKQADLILSMRVQQLSKSDEQKLKDKVNKIKSIIDKANNVDINNLILKTYKETVPMLERKSEVIDPIVFKSTVKEKQITESMSFNIESGFFVKGNKKLHDKERVIVITEDNVCLTFGKNDIKDGKYITDKNIVYWDVLSKETDGSVYIEFKDYHVLLKKNKLFTSRKVTQKFLYDDPILIQEPTEKQLNDMKVKSTRSSRGVKK